MSKRVISSILSAAISGLSANAGRVGTSANNLANVSTNGFKRTDVSTTSLVTRQSTNNTFSAGGVQTISRQLADVQGLLAASTSSTDLAISGNGFFTVSRSPGGSETLYTRDGSFRPDSEGNLVNASGNALKAFPTDTQGNVTGGLQALNANRIAGSADATSAISLGANLPTDAAVGETFNVDVQVIDSLGNPANVRLEFENKGSGTYGLSIGDVTDSNGNVLGAATEDTAGGDPYSVDVVFDSLGDVSGFDRDGDGAVDSATAPDVYVQLSAPASGASDLNISLDLGSGASREGLTRLSGDFTINTIESNGARYGEVSGVSVSSNGTVTAQFDNGDRRAIARVPVATFTNPNGLGALSGNLYRATDASGDATVRTAGEGGAGVVQGGAVELSTTDVGTEFVNMILAQRAYSANLKTLSTAESMSRELTDIIS